jgi:hypothetical protein
VLRWRVGSWQRLANMCRSSSLRAVLYLFKNWWAGANLVGFRMSRARKLTSHQHLGLDFACVSIRCSDVFSGDSFPIIVRLIGRYKSSQSVPAVENG